MKTFNDFAALPDSEELRMDFIRAAINEHRSSTAFHVARDADLYYDGENPTINRYEKIIYDLTGKAHKDMYTANHKLASKFFGFAVDQECSYLLGNGIMFQNEQTSDRLGDTFDLDVLQAARYAKIGGTSFGFWNLDHLQVFKLTEFVPLYEEENGALMGGVRFWQVAPDKPLRATLYELDGYTDYIQPVSKNMEILREKRPYKINVVRSEVDGTEIYDGGNYPGFPIVPLKNGERGLSELRGKRNTIDALDLVTSNMVNNVDEGNLIYWVLSNAGGMDDMDDAKFIDRIKTLHVAHADDAATVEPHTIEVPYAGTDATIDMLEKKLYMDFQCFDASAVTAGNQTATAIKASYVPMDLKADKFEADVTRFVLGVLHIAGIDDKPTYTRNKIVNTSEEIQTVLMAAEYFDEEYTTKKVLTLLGDIDQYEKMQKRKEDEAISRVSALEGELAQKEKELTAANNPTEGDMNGETNE